MEGTYLLAMWCPVQSRRESDPYDPNAGDRLPSLHGRSDGSLRYRLTEGPAGINRPGAPDRRSLNHAGSLVFFPSGAPWTKIAFERHERLVTGLTLTGIGAPLKAQRS